ncbi:hypothetical protein EJB05_23950, partial [Eragrostis curvula]
RFGYTDRPEYRSLSFVQDGTQYCEVQVAPAPVLIEVAPAPAPTEVAPVSAPAPAPAYGVLSESDEEPSEEEDAQMAEDDPELELLEDPLQGEEDTETEHEIDYPTDPGSDYSDSMDEDDFPVLEGYIPQYMLEMEEDEDQGVVNFAPVSDDQPVVVDPPAPQQPAPADVPAQQQLAPVAPPAQQEPVPLSTR